MIKAKKSLGQNFLTDKNILNKITEIISIKNKTVFEIGPGTGNLTSFILKNKPKKVIVVEKDKDLAFNLNNIFRDQLTIINDDILNIDENKIFNEKVTVFGNLPYNVSTEILSKWILNLKDNFWFDHLLLMFQKEVADRIIAKFNTSDYGLPQNRRRVYFFAIRKDIVDNPFVLDNEVIKKSSLHLNGSTSLKKYKNRIR